MPTWPSSLPDKPLSNGFVERAPSNVIRTPMERGAAQQRRRGTSAPRPFDVRFSLSKDQAATLDAFIRDDLADGALSFEYTHPRTGTLGRFRIVVEEGEPPAQYEHVGGTRWRVTMRLEQLPS